MSTIPRIQAALNGGRRPGWHPALPASPADLAVAARAAVAAGATFLHVHPRAPDGSESMTDAATASALAAIRSAVPGVPVGVSTGRWIAPGGAARIAALAAWTTRPDYVSVNLIEEDAPAMIAAALDSGIGVEAGLWSVADAERWLGLASAPRCLRVLIEINEQDEAAAAAAYQAVSARLDAAGVGLPRLSHGLDGPFWRVFRLALARGDDLRVGLEDGALLPDGTIASDNGALVAAAVRLAQTAGR